MDSRYQRHSLIQGWRQDLLSSATIILAGVGAVGNELLRILGMAGVGRLIICDPDIVSVSNLPRCSLFFEKDLGRPKVLAAKDNLLLLAPDTVVEARCDVFHHAVGLAEIRDAQLVLSCVDSHEARIELAARCQLVAAPYIDGGTNPWWGEVRFFLDPLGPCYACYHPDQVGAMTRRTTSCADEQPSETIGSSILMTSLVASWMAHFAIRQVLSLNCPTGILRIDGGTGLSTLVAGRRHPDCLFHSPLPADGIRKSAIHYRQTVGELIDDLPEAAALLLWRPVPMSLAEYDLRTCGRQEVLSDLGVPPKEIFPYIDDEVIHYIELS